MQTTKQMELMDDLIKKIKADKDLMITVYGSTYVTVEPLNHNDIFIYAQIGDWIKPHMAIVYHKIDCFTEKQATYSIELGYGEDITTLFNFMKAPNRK